jgi:uncharacterized membrane protein (DUF373 family)
MQATLPNATYKRIYIRIYAFWGTVEAGIYTAVACVLALAAVIALAGCGLVLWQGLRTWNSWDTMLRVIDGLLLVLMLVEILHTVRISIRSHVMAPEPFLVVGLIATIRRILLIALETANFSHPEQWHGEGETIFRASLVELALLGFLVLIFVSAICLLLRSQASPEEDNTAT